MPVVSGCLNDELKNRDPWSNENNYRFFTYYLMASTISWRKSEKLVLLGRKLNWTISLVLLSWPVRLVCLGRRYEAFKCQRTACEHPSRFITVIEADYVSQIFRTLWYLLDNPMECKRCKFDLSEPADVVGAILKVINTVIHTGIRAQTFPLSVNW